MIEFHNQFVKTSNESLFAVRFILISEDGNPSSPMMPKSTFSGHLLRNKWDLSAKSAVETMPSDSFDEHFNTGIYAVTYDQYKYKKGKWANVANSLDNKYRLLLLEYSTNDVISSTNDEIVLRQCNIIFGDSVSGFREKTDDGTLEKMQNDFQERKKILEECSFAHPIERLHNETLPYIRALQLEKRRISFSLAKMVMTYASVADRRRGRCDARTKVWFSLITPTITDGWSESDIRNYIHSIRKEFLSSLTDAEVEKLTDALIFSKFGKGVCTFENQIYYDARLTAISIVLFEPCEEWQFKTELFKKMKREGLMLYNERASFIFFEDKIEMILKEKYFMHKIQEK